MTPASGERLVREQEKEGDLTPASRLSYDLTPVAGLALVGHMLQAMRPVLGSGLFFLREIRDLTPAPQRMQAYLKTETRDDVQIPVAQRRPPPDALPEIERISESRNAAIVTVYETGAYSYQQIANHFGIHFTTVGAVVRRRGG